jgi:hypothetical protein
MPILRRSIGGSAVLALAAMLVAAAPISAAEPELQVVTAQVVVRDGDAWVLAQALASVDECYGTIRASLTQVRGSVVVTQGTTDGTPPDEGLPTPGFVCGGSSSITGLIFEAPGRPAFVPGTALLDYEIQIWAWDDTLIESATGSITVELRPDAPPGTFDWGGGAGQ